MLKPLNTLKACIGSEHTFHASPSANLATPRGIRFIHPWRVKRVRPVYRVVSSAGAPVELDGKDLVSGSDRIVELPLKRREMLLYPVLTYLAISQELAPVLPD
jgi:hypothetical protein